MEKNKLPKFEILAMIIGEAAVSALTVLVYILISKFNMSVVYGLILGTAVTVINFIILTVLANRALDKVMARRPEGEMDEDEAAEFAAKNQGEISAAMKISFLIRNALLLGTLILAFLLKNCFDVIATVIPLLAYTPILSVSGIIKRRFEK